MNSSKTRHYLIIIHMPASKPQYPIELIIYILVVGKKKLS